MNYERTTEEYSALLNAGIEPEAMGLFTVERDGDYLRREYLQNRMEQGYDVPEEFQPNEATSREIELKNQDKKMFYLETSRTNKELEGAPSKYKWYDDWDMMVDPETKEEIPIWIYEKRIKQEKKHEEYLAYLRSVRKRKNNLESARLLVALRERKLREFKEKRDRDLEYALSQIKK